MIQKRILFSGREFVLACDGKCHKAWGINSRPRLYYQEPGVQPRPLRDGEEPRDDDDHVYVRDSELGDAPADPGTYECDHAKPCATVLTDPALMNKWCARECERSERFDPGEPIVLRDLENPRPNIPDEYAPPRAPR